MRSTSRVCLAGLAGMRFPAGLVLVRDAEHRTVCFAFRVLLVWYICTK
jgi:hypothetical protein